MERSSVNTVSFLWPIQDQLVQVEEVMLSQADQNHPDLGAAMRHLLASGGKRIRPAVALLAGGMLGADKRRLVILSAAIELLHTATLVHDDLIDGSFLRRGIATLNSKWSPAATVLTGDFIFARAAKLAAETNSVAVMHLFAETLATIVNGEITQLFSRNGFISRQEYDQRIYAKTASMFILATEASAILSTSSQSVIDNLHRFGNEIGMAFQIVDDILDFTGEEGTVGKPVGSDLRQGLVTLPGIFFSASYPDSTDLKKIAKGEIVNEATIQQIVTSIRESNAIEQSLNVAIEYVSHANEILDELPRNEFQSALKQLTNYIVSRKL